MPVLYGLKTCDMCRKAAKALSAAGLDVKFHDIRNKPLNAATLTDFLGEFGTALINRRSTTWRGLSEEERAQPPVTLLALHPALMKRPIIELDGTLFLGWDPKTEAALVG